MLRYQSKSKKITQHVATHFAGIHKSPLIQDFLDHYKDLTIPYEFHNDTITIPNRYKEQEQEQYQDKEQKKEEKHVSSSYSEDFLKLWAIWTSLGRAKNKIEAYDKYKICLKGRNGNKPHDPVTATELFTAGEHYQEECISEGTSPQHVMLLRTFLGENQRWKDYVEVKEYVDPDVAYANEVIEEAKRDGK